MLFSLKLIVIVVLIITIIFISPTFLILILNKLKKREGRVNLTVPIQTSKFLGIKIVTWNAGVLNSIFLFLTIWSVIFPSVSEGAGAEFIILVPGIVLSLLIELPFLIFLLKKKNKQAIILSAVQCLLLLFLLGWVYVWDPFLRFYF